MGEPLRYDEICPSDRAGGQQWEGPAGGGVRDRVSSAGRFGQLRLIPDRPTAVAADVASPPTQTLPGPSAGAGTVSSLADHVAGLASGAACFACGRGRLEAGRAGDPAGSLTCPRCGAGLEPL